MNDEEIEVLKQSCELAISMFISRIIADFKTKTGKEISSITIPMIDVTEMGSAFDSKFIPGQCRIELAEKENGSPRPTDDMAYWVCCGGIHLELHEKCPVCGDSYE